MAPIDIEIKLKRADKIYRSGVSQPTREPQPQEPSLSLCLLLASPPSIHNSTFHELVACKSRPNVSPQRREVRAPPYCARYAPTQRGVCDTQKQDKFAGVVCVTSKDSFSHQGLSLTLDGSVRYVPSVFRDPQYWGT